VIEKTHLDLFSGIGGFAIAAQNCGYTTIGFGEKEPFAHKTSKNGSERFWPTPTHEGFDAQGHRGTQDTLHSRIKADPHCTPTSSTSTEPTTPELTCSQVDFLASLSVSPGSEEARKMTERSGRKCCELLGKPSPLGSLVKTLLESSQWNSTISFLTWKASATPRGRLLFRLVPSMPDTEGTEFGSSQDAMWRTPQASEAGARVETLYTKDGEPARPGERAYRKQPDGRMVLQSVTIGQQVKMWPTPTSDEASNVTRTSGAFQSLTRSVQESVKMWPTPTSHLAKETNAPSEANRNEPSISSIVGGSLNPQFVEWLMGYPKDWTEVQDFASGRKKTMPLQESLPESSTERTV